MSIESEYEARRCFFAGCKVKYPHWGYQPIKTEPMKWACDEHRDLLWKPATTSRPLPAPPPGDGDLFGSKR